MAVPVVDWRYFARSSLIAYEIAHDPLYNAAEFHHLIAQALERVLRKECRRLMIFVPPQHGKSRLVSESFPSFYLGHWPQSSIIHLGYSETFAKSWGQVTKDRINGDIHRAIFGCRAEGEMVKFKIYEEGKLQAGRYLAQGLDGGVTGNPADLIIIDDPIRNRKDVQSKAIMTNIRNNLSGAVRTRMHKDTAVIVMHTRWDEADPAGYLQQAWKEGWEILCLPALIETPEQAANDPLGRAIGEALWDARFPPDYLRETRNALPPRDWNALYQQTPTGTEGALFSYSDFAEYDDLPEGLTFYGFHDGALATPEEGEEPDFTELGIFGVDRDLNLYLVDWWTCQIDLDEWVKTAMDMAEDWGVKRWHAEKGQIAQASRPLFKREKMDRDMMHMPIEWMPHIGDKEVNVAAFRAWCRQGKVFVPSRKSDLWGTWVKRVLDQLVKFPGGANDDCVDTCGLAGRKIGDMLTMRRKNKGTPAPKHGSIEWLTQFAEHAVENERKSKGAVHRLAGNRRRRA